VSSGILIILKLTIDSAPVLYVKGRQHPVSIFHTSASQNDYLDAALRTFFQIHVDKPPGDILIFLPGISLFPAFLFVASSNHI